MAKWPTEEPPGATMISPVGGGGVDIPAGLEVAPRAPRRIKAPIEASSPFTASQFYITQTRRHAAIAPLLNRQQGNTETLVPTPTTPPAAPAPVMASLFPNGGTGTPFA